MNSDNGATIVIDNTDNLTSTKPESIEAWFSLYGKVKGVYVYRRNIVIVFVCERAATKAVEGEEGRMFLGQPTIVRRKQPSDTMVYGDLLAKYDGFDIVSPPVNEPVNGGQFQAPSSQGKEYNIKLLQNLMAQARFLGPEDTLRLYEAVEKLRLSRGVKTKPTTNLPAGRLWLDEKTRKLRAIHAEARTAFEQQPSDVSRRTLIHTADQAAFAASECERRWLQLISNEMADCQAALDELPAAADHPPFPDVPRPPAPRRQ